jgi:hypothetical protein
VPYLQQAAIVGRVYGILCAIFLIAVPAAIAQTQETEPNNDPATANAAVRGGRVKGTIEFGANADWDYWVINANTGDTIFADVDANEFGSPTDPTLALYASDGTTLVASNSEWDGLDPHITYVATVTGPYYIRIGSSYGAQGPQPYTINFFDVKCPAGEESEPNDSTTTAKNVSLPAAVHGLACPAGDRDFFKFTANAGSKLTIQVDTVGRERPSFGCACNIEAWIILYGSDGTTELARTHDYDYPKRLEYQVSQTGAFYVVVSMWPGGIRYPYIVKLSSSDSNPPPSGVTVAGVIAELLHPGTALTAAQRTELDTRGNQNGRYDVGDVRAYLIATGTLSVPGVKP